MARRIAVGVGSVAQDRAAMAWAARDAHPGSDEIHVAHVYRPLSLTGCTWPPAVRAGDARRSEARRVVAAAITAIRVARPNINVDGSAIEGRPPDVLIDFSSLADVLVIGDHRRGATAGSAPGATPRLGWQLVTQAKCPVVVVPCLDSHDERAVADLPVALLLEAGALPQRAIGFALASAARLDATLVVAETCPTPLTGVATSASELTTWETSQQEQLDVQLATWRERYADVGVIVELRREDPAATVDLLGRTARLLVLARQSDGIRGLGLLGRIALARTGCPVAIVPDAHDGAYQPQISVRELLSLEPVGVD
jgi:nucleotide-binding universal stress UspA family protein